MLFQVSKIKLINKMVAFSNEQELSEMTKYLRKKQPIIFDEIEQVSFDPRCFDASKFCLLFCAIALEQAELIYDYKFKKMLAHRILIARNLIAQDKYFVDKKFVRIISTIEKHVLRIQKFDEDDTFWLKLVIGSFIILLDLQIEDKEESIENFAYLI